MTGRARGDPGHNVWVWAILVGAGSLVVSVGIIKYGSQGHQAVKFIGGLLALVLLASAILRPQLAIVAYAGLIPLDMSSHLLGARVRVSDELLVALAVVLVPRVRIRSSDTWLAVGLGMLVIGSWTSAVFARDHWPAIGGSVRYSAMAVLVLAGCALCRSYPELKARLAVAFLIGVSVTAVFGILQKHGSTLIVGAPYLSGLPNSFLAYYTNYAGFLAMGFAVAIAIPLHRVNARHRAFYLAAGALCLVGLLDATSRGGLLAAAVALAVATVLGHGIGPKVRRVLIVAAVAVAAVLLVPSGLRTPIEKRLTDHSLTASEDSQRRFVQSLGRSLLIRHPLGIGYGNFSLYQTVSLSSSGLPNYHAQETFYQLGLDAGWIGLAGVAVITICALRQLVRTRDAFTIGAAAALAGFAAQGLNDYLLVDAPIIAALVICLVLMFGSSPEGSAAGSLGVAGGG